MAQTGVPSTREPSSTGSTVLVAAGLVYLALGILLSAVFVFGGLQSSLFPTGWVFPVVLLASGALMASRRRFDLVAVLWGGFTMAVFMLGVLVYVNALDRGFEDATVFDAAIIVAGLGLVPVLLRPAFRS
jgi:hypothetical protein